MDIVTDCIRRVTEAAATNKNPCLSYATRERAEKEAATEAQRVATYFDSKHREDVRPARYVIVQVPALNNRWVVFIDLAEVLGRADTTGGYLGVSRFWSF